MKPILVTGGTGHLGRDLLKQLRRRPFPVRVLARDPGRETDVEWAQGDLATGAGLAEALRDVDSVIHAATLSPIARRGSMRPADFFTSPPEVDINGTRHLLAACEGAGIKRFLYVSIAGVDAAALPYAKVKTAGETLVRESRLPWAVVRAAGFFYLLEGMIAGLKWLPAWPLPDVPLNPVDTTDVSVYLVECLDDWKCGMRDEIGGPETKSFVEFARQYQEAAGLKRRILPFSLSAQTALKMGFAEAHGRRGAKTWSTWLSEQQH
jgi:uncharacterized protein YbjT (DUF2867 family)